MTMKAASLTSSLLAPKGAAVPSGIAPPPAPTGFVPAAPENLEHDQKSLRAQVAALTSSFTREESQARQGEDGNTPASRVTKVVARSKKAASRRAKTSVRGSARAVRPKLDDLGRIKMSLRLDEKRHLMLKLAAAHLRVSAQELLVSALDDCLKKAAKEISCSQFSALVNGAEGQVENGGCSAKKA